MAPRYLCGNSFRGVYGDRFVAETCSEWNAPDFADDAANSSNADSDARNNTGEAGW